MDFDKWKIFGERRGIPSKQENRGRQSKQASARLELFDKISLESSNSWNDLILLESLSSTWI